MRQRVFSVSTLRLVVSLGVFGTLVTLNLLTLRAVRETHYVYTTVREIRQIQGTQAAQMTTIAARLIQRERDRQIASDATWLLHSDGALP